MNRKAFTPFLDREWQSLSTLDVSIAKFWPATFEIRQSKSHMALETWFHFDSGEGVILARISTKSIRHLIARWRNFLEICEGLEPQPASVGMFARALGKTILEGKDWTDDKGRGVGLIYLHQQGFNPGDEKILKIKIGAHFSATLPNFARWIDLLEEFHRPYLSPQPEQSE
jgi:hypothetical protein